MNIQGTYTTKGLALTAKTAAGACLRVSRVVGGSGHTTDVLNAAALPEIRQTLTVGEACCTGDTAVLPVTLAAVELETSYTLTELGVYAEDPDEGEILYCVYRLDEPVTIQAGSDTVLRFYLRQTVSKDGGARVRCSPAGLITESDCGPVRKMVLATGAPQRYVTMPASELQDYLDALPRLLTENHIITLSGTCSQAVYMKGFYGCGSLTLRADNLGDCVFTRGVFVENCGVPVTVEKLKWVIGSGAPKNESCIVCSSGEVMALECSFIGYIPQDGKRGGRGVTTINHAFLQLYDCEIQDFEIAANCFRFGQIDITGGGKTLNYSGNETGVYTHCGGLVMLGDMVPATLGAPANYKNSGGTIIQASKLI